ncbi:hypothetical protein JXC34_04295, partial [Candidatus Woesearchaeota archaeon]|nr:hypothetical protein [Candidatus Woesearchaeota archaeon]
NGLSVPSNTNVMPRLSQNAPEALEYVFFTARNNPNTPSRYLEFRYCLSEYLRNGMLLDFPDWILGYGLDMGIGGVHFGRTIDNEYGRHGIYAFNKESLPRLERAIEIDKAFMIDRLKTMNLYNLK